MSGKKVGVHGGYTCELLVEDGYQLKAVDVDRGSSIIRRSKGRDERVVPLADSTAQFFCATTWGRVPQQPTAAMAHSKIVYPRKNVVS